MATTFGDASAPSQKTINLDALFATSLAKYRPKLIDNIGRMDALVAKIMSNGMYESVDGGTNIEEMVLHELATGHSYDGYDTLDVSPVDGVTRSIWEWRQVAIPIAISGKEQIQNKQKIVSLIKTKIMQAEVGIKQLISDMIYQGNGAAALATPKVDALNGSSGIEPLAKLVALDPTTSTSIGNINQSTSTFWQNKTKNSSATTTTAFLQEILNLYNTCNRGSGTQPADLLVTDQITFELIQMSLYHRARQDVTTDQSFPFDNIKWKRALIVWDENMHDVTGGTLDATAAGAEGTLYVLNTQFIKLIYESSRNFVMSGEKIPVNQDAFVRHILWMGNMIVNNRRKHGVLASIARSLTVGDA